MILNAKEGRLALPDTQIDYITFGKGRKTLILIQGLNTRGIRGSAVMLAWMYRIFAKDYTVYLFDRRPDLWEGITIQDLAGDVAAAMDVLNITGADVLGVSQGGMIAQYLALQRPELVNKLVLAVTLSRNNDTVTQVIHHWMALTRQGKWKELVTDMAQNMYSDAYLRLYRPFLPLLTVLQKPKDVQRFLLLSEACLTCDTYDLLPNITCPVFVIGGQQDKVVSAEASREMAEKLGCRLYLYETLGHAAYEEAGDFNRKVYGFFAE